jgi:predicted TIM-barrel fold metal-dependent hydrolase
MGFELRPEWLGLVQEEILEPDRPIVDPHHHFFTETKLFPNYRIEDLWADTATHNVENTVFVQCEEHHFKDGPEELRPVGETVWVDGLAAEMAKGPAGAARVRAIVGTANMCLGAKVRDVLEAHCQASELFRGIRDTAAWTESDAVHQAARTGNAEMYADAAFREGFAELGELGLSFDAYHYHTQNRYLTDLARAFPDVVIVLDHLGTPLGVGPFAGKRDEIFQQWSKDLAELATCPNVNIKLGGMLMPWNGFGYETAERPPSSDEFVALQGRYYQRAIECFGPDRCMFESNFPVDKLSISYPVLWNAFKKIAAGYSEDEKDQMFRRTASRVYRID